MTTVLREELVEYSMLQKVREGLPTYGIYSSGEKQSVILREAFPTPEERGDELTMTTVALNLHIDDGGRNVELGSNLKQFNHTVEAWTFATEPRFGKHVAHAIRHVMLTGDSTVPLLDYNQSENPKIDVMLLGKVQVVRQVNSSPRPWDRYVWTTSIVVADYFTP